MPTRGATQEVRLDGDTIDLLRDEMRLAAREGAKQAVDSLLTEERAKAFFTIFFAVLREEMASGAGNWMLGRVWSLTRNSLWVLAAVGVLLMFGGPRLVHALWEALLTNLKG